MSKFFIICLMYKFMYYVNISIKWLKYESTNIFDTFPWSYGPLACWQYLFENFSSHWLQNNFILDIFESEIWKYQHCCIYLYIVYMLIYISIGVSDPDPNGSCVFAWIRIRIRFSNFSGSGSGFSRILGERKCRKGSISYLLEGT